MGTGEQRIIKILEKVITAEHHSLILIDEIDLLLHISSLRKLVEVLASLANKKHLQIVFTTHALEMANLTEYVGIQYINNAVKNFNSASIKNISVYDKINSELVYSLTGISIRPLKIYVEDEFAKIVVKKVLRTFNMSKVADVIMYGSISNAFTLAASISITQENISNTLIILVV